jgi:D-glycero-D-manno-heptose 1,7-bisphosphate phosphatase
MNSVAPSSPRPAAFVDRDGTLIVERGFLADPAGVELLPGAADGVRLLNEWGYRVIGISNQSGVARGYYGIDAVEAVNATVIRMFAERGAVIDRIYYCPHYGDENDAGRVPPCDCRKPAPGMIRQAQAAFAIDLSRSFVVGDHCCDIALADNVGIPGILVLTGHGRAQRDALGDGPAPAHVADDLLAAVRWWGQHIGAGIR